ncbi:MAG: chromosome segregation protein SMC [Bacilli bacterium]|nr:chromosome segregation protein SMC [Bacilli bacterium]
MILKQIKINGFKSFADKINIELEKGITGVVGPNGSGKSNIVDAVRWVLGEQSVKSLRGDGAMADVIFSGSKTRNPSNNASVTLVFDNSDHSLKIDYTEVSIKRSIYRTGENEYFINNEKVRLKDIIELLIDSGSGKESFSIISQGDISNIISTKAEDRRIVFESAAGVLKYKKRKEEAQRKLDKTHDNIDRVNDIINELELQVTPLKEQSEKASLYLKTKKELEDVEISLIVHDLDALNLEYNESKNKIEILNKSIIELSTSNTSFDASLSKKKIELSNLNDKLYSKQEELVNVTKEVEKLNGEKNIISERQKYKVDDVKLHDSILSFKEDKLKYNNNKEILENDIENIHKELDITNREIGKLNIEIDKCDIEKSKLSNEYSIIDKKITNNDYRINLLENSIDNNDKYSYAVKSVLNNPKLNGICDAIGNIVEIEDKYMNAIDTALGFSASFIITETEKDAESAINYLKSNSLGRVTFFPLNIIEPKTIDPNVYNILKDNKGFIDIASNLVKYDSKYTNIILNQLGNIIVVDDMKTANMISKKLNHKYRIVTLDGEIIHVGGSLTGGINKKSNSIILDKMELDKLIRENNSLKKDMDLLTININNNNELLDKLIIKIDSLKRKKIYNDELLNIKSNELDNVNEKLSDIETNINGTNNILNSSLSKEEENILDKYYSKVKERETIVNEINKLNALVKDIQDEINTLEHEFKTSGSEYYKKQNELKELEIKVGRLDVKLDTLLNTLTEEYSITYDKAKRDYVLSLPINDARKKVNELKKIINELGLVNLGAIDEYERVKTRYEFLNNQKNDLFKAENTLLEIIKEMDIVMTSEFNSTFKQIQIEFKKVFKELFNGGDAELKLTNPDDVLNTGIEIIALPPGKKLTSISLLSGGEKALTAISLLFAILRVKPVPFCILDEVEAPLDEANVDIFGKYVKKMEESTQFIIITHKKKTMEYAKVLYGITMQESGVSKLVSVRLEELK